MILLDQLFRVIIVFFCGAALLDTSIRPMYLFPLVLGWESTWTALENLEAVNIGNTIWLFNMAMENHWTSPFLIGKPSINGPWLYHGYVSHNQRVIRKNHNQLHPQIPSSFLICFIYEKVHRAKGADRKVWNAVFVNHVFFFFQH